jgi:hypothetical protein
MTNDRETVEAQNAHVTFKKRRRRRNLLHFAYLARLLVPLQWIGYLQYLSVVGVD